MLGIGSAKQELSVINMRDEKDEQSITRSVGVLKFLAAAATMRKPQKRCKIQTTNFGDETTNDESLNCADKRDQKK